MFGSIHEECGVFGIFESQKADPASSVYFGLYALQHRGQESCGIVVNDDGLFSNHRDVGIVNEVFTHPVLDSLPVAVIVWLKVVRILPSDSIFVCRPSA